MSPAKVKAAVKKTVVPELVDPEPPAVEESVQVEAEQPTILRLPWEGETWEVPATWDDLSIDATEHFALLAKAQQDGDLSVAVFADVAGFVRELLGPQQYRRLVKGRKVKDLNGFITAVVGAYGGKSQGE